MNIFSGHLKPPHLWKLFFFFKWRLEIAGFLNRFEEVVRGGWSLNILNSGTWNDHRVGYLQFAQWSSGLPLFWKSPRYIDISSSFFTQHGAQKHILSCCIVENILLFLDSWNEHTILVSFDAEKNPVIRRVCVHFGTVGWYISWALIEAQISEGHIPSLLTSRAFWKWSQTFQMVAECGECSVFSRPGEKQFS